MITIILNFIDIKFRNLILKIHQQKKRMKTLL